MRGTQWDIGYDEIFPGKLSENDGRPEKWVIDGSIRHVPGPLWEFQKTTSPGSFTFKTGDKHAEISSPFS